MCSIYILSNMNYCLVPQNKKKTKKLKRWGQIISQM